MKRSGKPQPVKGKKGAGPKTAIRRIYQQERHAKSKQIPAVTIQIERVGTSKEQS